MTTTTHCKDTGPWEPASCLLSTLTTVEPEPRLQLSSCTHLWSTRQGTACTTREAQKNSAPGTCTIWQGEEVAEARTKAKPGRLLAEGALRDRGL